MSKLPKVLRVGLVLDGRILSERLIRHGADVSVGSEPECSFVLPEEPGLPRDQTVFRARRGGYELHIDGRMQGRVADEGRVKPLSEVTTGPTWQLDEGARGRLVLGPRLSLLFQFVPSPPQPLRSGRQDFRPRYLEAEDPVFYGFLGMFSALAAVAMVYVYTQPPGQNLDIEEYDEVIARLVMTPSPLLEAPEPVVDPTAPSEALDPAPEPEGPTEVAEVSAPADNPRTAEARERHVRQNEVLEAFIIATSGINQHGDATSSLFGDDSVTVDDLDLALSRVSGVRTTSVGPIIRGPNTTYEDNGLDLIDRIPTEIVRVTAPETTIDTLPPTGLDPELKPTQVTQVAQLVRRQAPTLQRCYELALNDNPSLQGRVEIAWTIMEGHAEMVEVYRNGTGNDELAECMADRIERWTFPEELETDLIYPFVLTRGN